MEKRMIWNNDVGSEMDALEKDGFFAESEITSEEEKMDAAYEHINTALNDEAYNLSIDAGADIFLIGELQRWNGRGSAYANLETSNIGEAIKKALSVNLLLLFVLSQGVYLGIRCYLKNRLGTKQYW